MFHLQRKTTPRARNGKVQRKNRWAPTPNCYNVPQPVPVIDRERPGRGYRHLVRKEHLRRFIPFIPDWVELSRGLNVVVLARGRHDCLGWHRPGIVAICAWDRQIAWRGCATWFIDGHRQLLDKLDVPFTQTGDDDWDIEFTDATARAFLLVHVLIHELGHHHDRMTTRSKRHSCRGERYAEDYARRYEDVILDGYRRELGR